MLNAPTSTFRKCALRTSGRWGGRCTNEIVGIARIQVQLLIISAPINDTMWSRRWFGLRMQDIQLLRQHAGSTKSYAMAQPLLSGARTAR